MSSRCSVKTALGLKFRPAKAVLIVSREGSLYVTFNKQPMRLLSNSLAHQGRWAQAWKAAGALGRVRRQRSAPGAKAARGSCGRLGSHRGHRRSAPTCATPGGGRRRPRGHWQGCSGRPREADSTGPLPSPRPPEPDESLDVTGLGAQRERRETDGREAAGPQLPVPRRRRLPAGHLRVPWPGALHQGPPLRRASIAAGPANP